MIPREKVRVQVEILRNEKGETIAETLVAILIGVLALLMLPMAIVTSAKINHKIAKDDRTRTVEVRENTGGTSTVTQITGEGVGVSITNSTSNVAVSEVKIYKDSAGYIFYKYESAPPASGEP